MLLRAGCLALLLVSRCLPAAPQNVVSINLCTDQLLVRLAAVDQIRSLSWLAGDPAESPIWSEARPFPANQGSVEEILALNPDLVLAGRYTGSFTKTFLKRVGYPVLEIPPANSLEEVYSNIRAVAAALGRSARGEQVIQDMLAAVAEFEAQINGSRRPAVIVQPGGFTVGANSVGHELLLLAGFSNQAADMGLDRWGSLSVEALLSSGAERLIVASYRADAPSLANEFIGHRVFRRLATRMELVPVPAVLFACGAPEVLAAVELMAGPVASGPRR